MPAPTVASLRRHFPALQRADGWALLENAGGSQVPTGVIDGMRRYMTNNFVQLGAGYPLSDACDQVVESAHRICGVLMGAADWQSEVVLGSSCSVHCAALADAFADVLGPGDEIVVSSSGHEANIGPWLKAARRSGAGVRWWRPTPTGGVDGGHSTCPLPSLIDLLSERTRLVCFPHVSNLLGEIVDVAAITRAVRQHAPRARTVVDAVAYAPHQVMDVARWDVDFYVYSVYKVLGPHCSALYGRKGAWAGLSGPNHYFIDRELAYKWELGGVSHEACAGICGLVPYLREAAGMTAGGSLTRDVVVKAFARFSELEAPLVARLMSYLRSKPGVTIVGPTTADPKVRVGTVSFIHDAVHPEELVRIAHGAKCAIRNGHMYSPRVLEDLGYNGDGGVARISCVHYNTIDEVDRFCAALEAALPKSAKL